jgi:AraC family transcriptional regulator
MSNDEIAGFVGTPQQCRQQAGFSFGHWVATQTGDDVREHAHTEPHFMFIAAGRFATAAGSGRSPLIYNPPNTVHRDHFESRSGRFFAISAEPSALAGGEMTGVARRVERIEEHVIVIRLMRECASWDHDSPTIAESLCLALFSGLDRRRIDAAPRWLTTAAAMLCEQGEEPVTIGELSRHLGVHRTHLTRTFLRVHGCTPAEFSRLHRLRRAADLLSTTRAPIVEIALASGFTDQSHFTKHFRRTWSITPGQFRRLAR